MTNILFAMLVLGIAFGAVILPRNRVVIMYLAPIFIVYLVFGISGLVLIKMGFFKNTYFINAIDGPHYVNEALNLILLSFFLFIVFFSISVRMAKTVLRSKLNLTLDSITSGATLPLFLTFLSVSIVYLISIHPSPLFVSITGSAESSYLRRIDVTRDYQGIGMISTLARSLSYIAALWAFLQLTNEMVTWKGKVLYAMTILLTSFVILSNGEKAPIVILFLSFIYIKLFFAKSFKFRSILLSISISFALLVFTYKIFTGSSIVDVIEMISYRVFVGQSISIPLSIQYHEQVPFTGVSTAASGSLRLIFGVEELRSPLSQYLMWTYFPEMTKAGAYNINGIFVGEAYGWGGHFGVMFGSIIYGIYNGVFVSFFDYFKRNYWLLAFFFYSATHLSGLMTSFSLVLLSTHMVLTGLVVFSLSCRFRLKSLVRNYAR